MNDPWFHFGTHKKAIGGRSSPRNALWNAWYILHKIWYIQSYCFRVPHLNMDGTWFHFGTHKEVIGGRSPPWNALWNPWYILHNVPNFVKDVPNFVKNIPNFVNDVPMFPKYIMRWGTTSITSWGSLKEKMTMEMEISVPLAQRFDVSNFLNDVPRVAKSILE